LVSTHDDELESTLTLGLIGRESSAPHDDATAQIVVLVGPSAGLRVPIRAAIVIGRDADCALAIDDDGVSRRHTTIRRAGGGEFILEDLGSRNGTYVNGVRTSTASLQSGDKIALGTTSILLFTRHDRYEEQVLQAQKLHLLGQLAGGIAHDFNNLIVTVLGNTSYLKDKATTPAEAADCLDEIESAARRAAELTAQLMSFSRPQRRAREAVAIAPLVQEVVGLLRRTVPRSLEISTNVPPDLAVIGDASQLLQVLMNGCVNAKQAMPYGGVLRIDARRVFGLGATGSLAHICIEDTGIGMDAATLAAAFQPFFTTKAKGEGTGLGLATAYRIVRSHGGDVSLQSQVGVGTRLTITLPAVESRDIPVEQDAPPERPRLQGRVLLADDEALVRNTTRRWLERFGLDVEIATNGTEAVEAHASAKTPFGVALIDLDMPQLDGEQAIRRIREREPGLPVIVISGHAEPTREQRLSAGGRTTILHKPFDVDALWRQLADALGGPPDPVANPLPEPLQDPAS
jgi:signal transduction histidine kinase/CheY-like chemotaxis protein